MNGILVRVGVDHSYGGWNAPVDPETLEFTYVPIPEGAKGVLPGCGRRYPEVAGPMERFLVSRGAADERPHYPVAEMGDGLMHLDPDYEHLTYGDNGSSRGSGVARLVRGDLVVFYSGLRPIRPCGRKLIYALVGLYVVDEVVKAADVPMARRHENAHTRKDPVHDKDIVVRAKGGVSGRCSRCVEVGEYRDRAYRVRKDLLEVWGGLSVNDGYIQRSARPPQFLDAAKFYEWFLQQRVPLVRNNFGEEEKRRGRRARGPKAQVSEYRDTVAPDVDSVARVVVVHLRRPVAGKAGESRSDPFYEFGSFGCTGCHRKNLMHPRRIHELEGARLAFAQGGPLGFRLICLTPPVRVAKGKDRCELTWKPNGPVFRYDSAPALVDNEGRSDVPGVIEMLRGVNRTTWNARFSSAFRTRRQALPSTVGEAMASVYDRRVRAARSAELATSYVETMPSPPQSPDTDRRMKLETLRAKHGMATREGC